MEPARWLTLQDGRVVLLRRLTPADAEALAEFFASLTEREIYFFYARDADEARAIALHSERDRAYRLIAVARVGDEPRILGYFYLEWRDDETPSFGACLRPGVQSAGLGRAMIDHLLTSAASSGVERARLSVHPDNPRALRLYQRAGFRVTGEFVNQHQGTPQYRMEADLQNPRPEIDPTLTIVPYGAPGAATIAADVQAGVLARTGRLPLILDRPATPSSRLLLVVNLARPPTPWGDDEDRTGGDTGWVAALDRRHTLVAGVGLDPLREAARRYLRDL
ncbi:MAG TPA: GNAT family protein [Chloroflexota bacterium]|nr:GNAT family protein [Chloroflexota bacterium]